MAQIGDILRLTLNGTYLGQQVRNVFFYEVAVGSTGGLAIGGFVDEWETDFQTRVADYLNPLYTADNVLVENLTDGLQFENVSVDIEGGLAGTAMPSFVSMSVRQNRSSKLTRNGYKRYAGLSEETVTVNSVGFSQGVRDIIAAFHSGFLQYLDYDGNGNDYILENVIVGRTKNAQGVYEVDLNRVNPVFTALVQDLVTTQNTRKA